MLGKFLAVDPGETTGWSVWRGTDLLDAGQTPMWDFGIAVQSAAIEARHAVKDGTQPDDVQEIIDLLDGIELVVIEDWRLYPWELRTGHMDWDECRTARLIGSIYQSSLLAEWEYEQQPAKIKERAMAAGAESFFRRPLHENRHMNDSMMHGVFRNALEAGAPWTDLSSKQFDVDTSVASSDTP